MITVEQIERRVERHTNLLDGVYLARQIDKETYDAAMRDLHDWADAAYQQAKIWERHNGP